MRHVNYSCLLLALFPVLAFAGKSEGVAAFERRDYQSAIAELTPAARDGDAEAQYYLARSLKVRNARRHGRKRPNELDSEQQEAHAWAQIGEREQLVQPLAGVDPAGIDGDRPVRSQAQTAARLGLPDPRQHPVDVGAVMRDQQAVSRPHATMAYLYLS